MNRGREVGMSFAGREVCFASEGRGGGGIGNRVAAGTQEAAAPEANTPFPLVSLEMKQERISETTTLQLQHGNIPARARVKPFNAMSR